jgi:death-on-curing protein
VTEWHWLRKDVILAIHDEQLAEHGGRPGIRDLGLLESALARPLNRAAYAEVNVFDLAAASPSCETIRSSMATSASLFWLRLCF